MNSKKRKIAIIGAGICGLTLADQLKTDSNLEVHIFEKSKAIGGRIATRRIDSDRFDHGAQKYELTDIMKSLHEKWVLNSKSQFWFQDSQKQFFYGSQGMTSLTKFLAKGLNIHFDSKLVKLEKTAQNWSLTFDNRATDFFDTVILTAPLPQSLQVLVDSHVDYNQDLNSIQYSKALVLLVQSVASNDFKLPETGYLENPTHTDIQSIADQKSKGMTHDSCWTVVMNPKFSDLYFDQDSEKTISIIINQLKTIAPHFEYKSSDFKKWRYSFPLSTVHNSNGYLVVQPELYLAGDSFIDSSINGAVQSAYLLLNHLQKIK